jgi:hypothetical protein
MTIFDGGQSGTDPFDGSQHVNGSEAIHPTTHFGGEHTLFHSGVTNHGTSASTHFASGAEPMNNYHDVMQHTDPLKLVHSMHMEPLNLGKTFTYPHSVDPYIHQDGTVVRGHMRYMPE